MGALAIAGTIATSPFTRSWYSRWGAYDQEVQVTEQITAIYNVAAEGNDRITQNFLQWFIEEQVEEVASMDTLLKIADRAGDNLFPIEHYVAREGHPEDAAG